MDHTKYLCNTCGVDHALVYLWADLTNLRPVEILLEFCKAFLICRFNIDFTGMSIYKFIEKKSCQYIDMTNIGYRNFKFLCQSQKNTRYLTALQNNAEGPSQFVWPECFGVGEKGLCIHVG